jgi:predicted nucleic acid-binding protein
MTRVVDASAIAALLFNEGAALWVQDETFGELLLAPGLIHFELGNLCWKKMRRSPEQADALQRNWLNWNVSPPVTLIDTDLAGTIHLAHGHNLTFYDASYLWLAHDRSADLISLDAKLVRAARSLGLHAPAPDDGGHTAPRARS